MIKDIIKEKSMERNVALLVLRSKDGKFLFQHRAEHLERHPGIWGFFGGGIEAGETSLEGLHREVGEETGYILDNPRLLSKESYIGVHSTGKRYIFLEDYDHKQEIILCEESQNYGWFTLEELKSLDVHDADRETIFQLSELINNLK